MKFTFAIAALVGLAAAAPAPTVNGQLICGENKGAIFGCPFGQICVLAPGAEKTATSGICQSRS